MKPGHQPVRTSGLAGLLTGLATAVVAVSVAASAGAADQRLNDQDRLFLRAAHQSNLFEIASARIALQEATAPAVRDLANRWITDHTALDQPLTAAAGALDVALPGPAPAQEQLLTNYRAASDAEFDEVWVTTQITAHLQAEALVDAELGAGSAPSVRVLAEAARPVIVAHHHLLTAAAPVVGVVIGAAPDAPTTGTAPSPAVVQSPTSDARGWTNPTPGTPDDGSGPIPIPAGPGPSLTVGP